MDSGRPHERSTAFDRMLTPVHRWIWGDAERRVQKLLRFGETETDGGRDILRAAEVTSDPLLRRLYLEHAIDEFRHGVLFRDRAAALLSMVRSRSNQGFQGEWLAPGGHGLDDLQVDGESDHTMLAFLHLSEKAAASHHACFSSSIGKGGRQPFRRLSQRDAARSADTCDFRRDSARRNVSHELHTYATHPSRSAASSASFMACAFQSTLENLFAAGDCACRNPRVHSANHSIFHPATALRLAG